jgi:hypothetical protein
MGYTQTNKSGGLDVYTLDGNRIPANAVKEWYDVGTEPRMQQNDPTAFEQEQKMAEAMYAKKVPMPTDPKQLDAWRGAARQAWTQDQRADPQESWGAPAQFFNEQGQPVLVQSSNRGAIRSPQMPGGASTKTGLTAATRQLGETAKAIIPVFDKWIGRLGNPRDPLIAKLGPYMGRWNEFMAGSVGKGDPDFAYFRSQLGLLQTGTMRAHVGQRGGTALLDKFEKMFNGKTMDAATLKSSMQGIRDFLTIYRDEVYPEQAGGIADPFSGMSNGDVLKKAQSGDQAARDEYIRRFESQGKKK